MTVTPYRDELRGSWDALVATSFNGTFLHSRRFIAYHGDRFADRSLVIHDSAGHLVGVMPAAVSRTDSTHVVSHPGLTYGGIVHGRRLVAGAVLQALERALEHYRALGFRRLVYKAVPRIFHTVPAEDDLYALFRLGAVRSQCDLSAAIDLAHRAPLSARRARRLDEARSHGLVIQRDPACLGEYWPMLTANLAERHHKVPVHTLEEMTDLMERCPSEIALVSAKVEGELVAGALLFTTRSTVHTQYLASNERGQEMGALDCVIEDCVALAVSQGHDYFSFGISTEQDGTVLNDGLQVFKLKFGASGVVHETYSISL